ncbi:DUF4381 domain-containing protein [Rhizobium rhizogenes]|uniref:DUF4381 domain-containing protein n=1 Tax=Rhizobium rhizogenes TaxID=359 RepID=UPI0022C0048C|nr:DUF4381 domain-containing protein [Rhizobium rhizogenes]MCZ7463817.1 DUF4381 domain-containing protein [Rhizobium rhizogenes]
METTTLDPTAATALRTMHDIVVPAPVSWFPQTWGWAAVLVVLIVLLCMWAASAIRRYQRNAYRRKALEELQSAAVAARDETTRDRGLHMLATLLKRTALAAWPRKRVASLSGAAFISFLKNSVKATDTDGLADLLDDREYRDTAALAGLPSEDCDRAFEAARWWIERHHVST